MLIDYVDYHSTVVDENCSVIIVRVTDAQVSACKKVLPSLVEREVAASNFTAQKPNEVHEKHSSNNHDFVAAEEEPNEDFNDVDQNDAVKDVEATSKVS